MFFGLKHLQGPLREGEREGGGGGTDNAPAPLTAEALAQMLSDRDAKLLDTWKKDQEAREKAAEKTRKAEQAESQRKADEAKRQAEEAERKKEEERRATEGGIDKQTEYKLQKLQRDLDEQKRLRELADAASAEKDKQAAEKDRVLAIRSALSGYDLAKGGVELAFKAVRDEITRDEDGKLVGPNGAPLVDFLNDQFKPNGPLELFLNPKAASGSGATGGSGGHGSGAVHVETIKPGANNEAARAEIARLANELMRGGR